MGFLNTWFEIQSLWLLLNLTGTQKFHQGLVVALFLYLKNWGQRSNIMVLAFEQSLILLISVVFVFDVFVTWENSQFDIFPFGPLQAGCAAFTRISEMSRKCVTSRPRLDQPIIT